MVLPCIWRSCKKSFCKVATGDSNKDGEIGDSLGTMSHLLTILPHKALTHLFKSYDVSVFTISLLLKTHLELLSLLQLVKLLCIIYRAKRVLPV